MLEADYLVVGAGAAGMAFTDALIDHADVSVVHGRPPARRGRALARRVPVRPAAPGVGVLRRRLDPARRGRVQQDGPEAGLHERATAPEICAYYDRVLRDRMLALGQGDVLPELRVPRRPRSSCRACPGSGTRSPGSARRRRPLPGARDPGHDAAAVRRADGAHGSPVNELVELDAAPVAVRRRRLGQDRDRRRASGCSERASIPTRSAGSGRVTRGCSTAPWSSRTRRSSSAWRRTSWRPRPARRRPTRCSCAWRRPGSCCASTAP